MSVRYRFLRLKRLIIALVGLLLVLPIWAKPPEDTKLNLHVPSPDWQDQIIYFVLLDRFNDGDSANNDQGKGEYDPSDHRKFSGGDIQGVIDKLDYIKSLGATAVWITPPVANQWWDPQISYGGYHGYWAENFKEMDVHFGALETYQQLSHELHEREMYLIQDIVINHTGNYFSYNGGYDPEDPTAFFTPNTTSLPTDRPTQYPFNMNNVRNPEHRQAGIYNWTPMINQFDDELQRVKYQLSGLDDINTENPAVRKAFRDAYGYWIKKVGVDGFRIDTIIYVEHDFWHDFVHSTAADAPGMKAVAASTGREDFLTFGEALLSAKPLDDAGEKQVASYLGTPEKPGLSSVLNFPLYFTLGRVFSEGGPTNYLGYRLQNAAAGEIYPNPFIIPTFIDNHDTKRFISTANSAAFKQALLLIMTIPGIPIIYQGTEQMFREQRRAMFAEGYKSGGENHFSETSETFKYLQSLIDVRRDNKLFTRGNLTVLQDSPVGPGVLAYKREYQEESALVIFNSAKQRILMNRLETALPAGTQLQLVKGLGISENLTVGVDGTITTVLPPQSAAIYLVENSIAQVDAPNASISVNADIEGKRFQEAIAVSGTVQGKAANPQLVIDGLLDRSIAIAPAANGNWSVQIPISRFPFGETVHQVTAYLPGANVSSTTRQFTSNVAIQGETVAIEDPAGDDHGPAGNYLKPQDQTFTSQMDIRKVAVTSFGGNLQVDITMTEVTRMWIPPNGFDHVVFHIFIDVPGQEGVSVLPYMNSNTPDDFAWDYFSYVGGWNNILSSAAGAHEKNFGAQATPVPEVAVDMAAKTVSFLFKPAALGYPETLAGGKVYVTTWDGSGAEGFHRKLSQEGAAFEFGGGNSEKDPLILDDTPVIIIPGDAR